MVDELTHAGFVEGLKLTAESAYIALQRCVASSLKALQPGDRLSLAQLSIFPSKFDGLSAAAVLGVDERVAKRQLRQLQERSLVIAEASQPDQKVQQQQYGLHLFIRDMALSGYEQHEQYLSAQRRFVQQFVAMLRAHKHRHTPEGIKSLRQLACQRHNLVKLFALLAGQQQLPLATAQLLQPPLVTAQLLADCCNLHLAALDAVWLLRLDLDLVRTALENLLKLATASNLTDSVIHAQEQLGFVLTYESDQTERAEELLSSALQARKHAGRDDMLLVMSLLGLARVINDKVNASDIDESEGYMQGRQHCTAAHSILLRAKGESDPETLSAALFGCSFLQSESEQVVAIKHVLDSALKALPPSHPAVLDIKSELASASNSQLAESIPILTEHLQQCMSQAGHNERSIPEAMLMLGNALAHSKDASQQQEGVQHIYKGLQLAEGCFLPEDLIIARQETLGRALIATNRPTEAVKVLEDSLPVCEEECGKDSRITWIGYTILADAHEAEGDFDAAARAFEMAHARIKLSARRQCGKQDEQVFIIRSGIWCQIACNLELRGRWVVR